jgi:hypothetical protein
VISDDVKRKILDMKDQGRSQARISELLDVSLSSIKRYWNAPRPTPSAEHLRPTLDDLVVATAEDTPKPRAAPDVFSIPSYLVDGEDVGRILAVDRTSFLALANWAPRSDVDSHLRTDWLLKQPEVKRWYVGGGDRHERWVVPPGNLPRERRLIFRLDNIVQLKRLIHAALYDARERGDTLPTDNDGLAKVLAPIYHSWEEGFFTDDTPRQGRGAWSPPSIDAFHGQYASSGPDWRIDPARHFYRRGDR